MDMVRVGGGGGSASTTPTKPLSGVTGGLSPSSYHMAYSTPIGPMLESLGDSPFKVSHTGVRFAAACIVALLS